MPYNPGVSYQGSNYIFSGIAQGAQNMASGLASAAAAIGDAGVKAVEKYKLTQEELGFLNGMADSLARAGALQPDELEKFHSGSLGTKRAIVSRGGTKAQQAFDQQMQNARLQQEKELADARNRTSIETAKISHPNQEPFQPSIIPMKDPNDPNKTLGYALTTSRNSAVPFQNPNEEGIEEIQTPAGMFLRDKRTGKILGRSQNQSLTSERTNKFEDLREFMNATKSDEVQNKIKANTEKITSLQKDISVNDKIVGPEWAAKIPLIGKLFPNKENKLKALAEENAKLQQQSQELQPQNSTRPGILRPGLNTGGGAGGSTSSTPPEAKSEPKSITPVILADYLRRAGGDRKKAAAMAIADGYNVPMP